MRIPLAKIYVNYVRARAREEVKVALFWFLRAPIHLLELSFYLPETRLNALCNFLVKPQIFFRSRRCPRVDAFDALDVAKPLRMGLKKIRHVDGISHFHNHPVGEMKAPDFPVASRGFTFSIPQWTTGMITGVLRALATRAPTPLRRCVWVPPMPYSGGCQHLPSGNMWSHAFFRNSLSANTFMPTCCKPAPRRMGSPLARPKKDANAGLT